MSSRDSFWHKKSMNGGEGERGTISIISELSSSELIKQNIKSVHCTSEREGGPGLVRSFVSAFMLPLPKLYVGSFSGGCCWQRRRTRTRWWRSRPRPRRRWRALSGRDIYIGWLVATAGAAVTQPGFDEHAFALVKYCRRFGLLAGQTSLSQLKDEAKFTKLTARWWKSSHSSLVQFSLSPFWLATAAASSPSLPPSSIR